MMEGLLNLIYGTRSGKRNLYMEIIRSALPWFFAYDRQNYMRYITAHYYDFLLLKGSHPEHYAEFQNDNFSVQLSESNSFARMEMDKVIETTINNDTKTPGVTTGALKMYWSTSYQITLSAKYVPCIYFPKIDGISFPEIKYTQGSQWNMGVFKKLLCI